MNISNIRSMLGFELLNANVALEVAKAHVDIGVAANKCRTALGVGNTIIQVLDIDVLEDRVFDAELLVERLTERVLDMDQCYWPHRLEHVEDPLAIEELA